MGAAIEIEMALDQAVQFEKQLQLLFMQAGKIDVWNKIKMRSAALDVEAAHEARRAKEAAARRKRKINETIEITFAVLLSIVLLVVLGWGLYELLNYCKVARCG